jgi:hypothetical protein
MLIKKLGVFPLHLNMLTTTDVEECIIDGNFLIIEKERILHGITTSFVIAKKV